MDFTVCGKGRTKEERKILNEFRKIKEMGYHRSKRKNDTGVGKTYECLMGIQENNKPTPDMCGFEIKTHRKKSSSKITLFTKSPTYPPKANTRLRTEYGFCDDDGDMNILNVSASMLSKSNHISGYTFLLRDDIDRMTLLVYDGQKMVDDSTYWLYSDIRRVLSKKMKCMAFVVADVRRRNGKEYFHYDDIVLYEKLISMNGFIDLLNDGVITVDLRLGVYGTGKKKGRTHDHGTAFRIKQDDLHRLYRTHFPHAFPE